MKYYKKYPKNQSQQFASVRINSVKEAKVKFTIQLVQVALLLLESASNMHVCISPTSEYQHELFRS